MVLTARRLAMEIHQGQTRKGSDEPYFEGHHEPVAELVEQAGGTAEQIAAAYLHDAAEDGGGEAVLRRISDVVGPGVAAIVADLSDSLVDTSSGAEKEPWEVRKTRYLEALPHKPRVSLEVYLADKVHNADAILVDYDEMGEAVWGRFKKTDAEYHLWYYEELSDVFVTSLAGHALVDRLTRTVEALEARVAVAVPDIRERVDAVRADLSSAADGRRSRLPTWDAEDLQVGGDDARTARYRRLQSWWRSVQLVASPGPSGNRLRVGSSLHPDDVAAQPDLNFLHPLAYQHAEARIAAAAAEGATLEEDRLRRNLLSSMPLCFNLFGTLAAHPQAIDVVKAVIDPGAEAVVEITCEWSPRPASAHLGDRTAFDAYLGYTTASGDRFVGIETKYTEPFSATEYERDEYRQVAEASGWFTDPVAACDRLRGSATNQLWRQVLLCASWEAASELAGSAVVVCPADDERARSAVDVVRAELADPERLRRLSLERIVGACDAIGGPISRFSARFADRYLDPDSPHGAERGGPRLGRPLTAP